MPASCAPATHPKPWSPVLRMQQAAGKCIKSVLQTDTLVVSK
jgi:hypothetical protein